VTTIAMDIRITGAQSRFFWVVDMVDIVDRVDGGCRM